MTLSLMLLGAMLAGIVVWIAIATVGVVSILIHPRNPPNTLGEWVLCVCRGAAYIAGAVIGALIGIYAVFEIGRPSIYAAVIIAFALVGLRMRHARHGTGDSDAT